MRDSSQGKVKPSNSSSSNIISTQLRGKRQQAPKTNDNDSSVLAVNSSTTTFNREPLSLADRDCRRTWKKVLHIYRQQCIDREHPTTSTYIQHTYNDNAPITPSVYPSPSLLEDTLFHDWSEQRRARPPPRARTFGVVSGLGGGARHSAPL